MSKRFQATNRGWKYTPLEILSKIAKMAAPTQLNGINNTKQRKQK